MDSWSWGGLSQAYLNLLHLVLFVYILILIQQHFKHCTIHYFCYFYIHHQDWLQHMALHRNKWRLAEDWWIQTHLKIILDLFWKVLHNISLKTFIFSVTLAECYIFIMTLCMRLITQGCCNAHPTSFLGHTCEKWLPLCFSSVLVQAFHQASPWLPCNSLHLSNCNSIVHNVEFVTHHIL